MAQLSKMKKLLRVIAESAPFKPNISALSNKLDISCDRILEYPEVRNLRETFLSSQFLTAGYEVHEPQHGDFLVNGITIEVGGKNKSSLQVSHSQNYMIAADAIETGWGSKVPLWWFEFLY